MCIFYYIYDHLICCFWSFCVELRALCRMLPADHRSIAVCIFSMVAVCIFSTVAAFAACGVECGRPVAKQPDFEKLGSFARFFSTLSKNLPSNGMVFRRLLISPEKPSSQLMSCDNFQKPAPSIPPRKNLISKNSALLRGFFRLCRKISPLTVWFFDASSSAQENPLRK